MRFAFIGKILETGLGFDIINSLAHGITPLHRGLRTTHSNTRHS
jgi:hypothetical protein